MDDIKQLLGRVNLFRGLDDDQLTRVAAITHAETFDTGEIIFEQDDDGDKMYVVGSGQVEIKVKNETGDLHSVLILGQGQSFGEMALLDQGPRSASVVAIQPHTILYALSGDHFKTLCASDTAIGYIMMRNIALDLSFKIRHQNLFS
jgi:CRP-like cAMP-binding protein